MTDLNLIRRRFLDSHIVNGNNDEIVTPSGVRIRGRYILTESGAVTPSHDPLNGFRMSEGFPTDDNGLTVNDRDYERDADAQRITRDIAAAYDSRAISSAVVVSKDGVVLSGNGRTMAGMIAAANNTDADYIGYVSQYSAKYGFTSADLSLYQHPRIVFLVDDDYDYTTEVFAMFNAQDTKTQSKTEDAVKMGKIVDDETFARIIRSINTFETISEFYADTKAATEAVNLLLKAKVINQMKYPEMFDGDSISQTARETLENVLIGKAFESNPDCIRQITAFKGVRKNILTALAEISNNLALADYSLENELSQAIALCYQARANGCFRQGDVISGFARQMTMFADTETLADFRDKNVMLLADTVNHSQVTRLKKLFALYNNQAANSASGQTDMFSCGSIKTKEEILQDVHALFGTRKELDDALSQATADRKQNAEDAIWMEKAKTFTNFNGVYDDVSTNGVRIGSFAALPLPCGDMIVVKLELLSNGIAGIRLRGFKRIKVNEELLIPTNLTHCTLPDWLSPDVPKDSLFDVLFSYRKVA